MHIINMISVATANKPETPIIGEALNIRERQEGEEVHFKENPEGMYCLVCGRSGWFVWLQSRDKHEVHPNRCSV